MQCNPALVAGWYRTAVANSSEGGLDPPASLLGLCTCGSVLAVGAS